MELRPGFTRKELEARYNVDSLTEDEWHAYSGRKTAEIVASHLSLSRGSSRLLLNAGAGVHELNLPPWEEICVDLFAAPLRRHKKAICADIGKLPFAVAQFGAVVCVGEVLGYC